MRNNLSSRVSTSGINRRIAAGPRVGTRGRTSPAAPQSSLRLELDPLRLQLFLLTIFTISRVHLHYPILAKFRPLLLLSAVALGYVYLNPRTLTSRNVLALWPMKLVGLLAILACCSAPFGLSLGGSASFILDSFAKTIAYAFLVAMSIRHVRDLYTYIWAYVISCGILALMCMLVFDLSEGGGAVARLAELYTYDSNDLGVIMMIGLPLTLLLLAVDRGLKRWLLLGILLGTAATMARSGSRGGFLGLIAVGAASLFLVKGVSVARRISLLAATAIALSRAAPAGYWKQMATILAPKSDYNYTDSEGRTAVMKRGIGYMKRYPVFGIGIWNFARAECTISSKVDERTVNGPIRCTAPHNSFVQAGAELGVPGLIVWLALLLGLIIAPLRMRRRIPPPWRRGSVEERFLYGATSFFSIAAIGFAVTAFFVTFAFADPIYLLAAFLAGLYVSLDVQLRSERSAGVRDRRGVTSSRSFAGWRVRGTRQQPLHPSLNPS